jgi:hypothetical protein
MDMRLDYSYVVRRIIVYSLEYTYLSSTPYLARYITSGQFESLYCMFVLRKIYTSYNLQV